MNKVISGIIPTAIILVFFCGAISPVIGDGDFPKTIVDSANRTVTIDEPVERIVPIVSWSYEPVWILGLNDKVVGVTTTAKDPTVYQWLPGLENKQSVGTYREPDYEKIVELDSDLVIVGKSAGASAEEMLAPAGIPVICLNFNDPTTFDNEFKILASLTGTDENADSFISWKQDQLEEITSRTSDIENKIRVYPNWCDYPLLSASNGSGIHNVIAMAGGINIASGLGVMYPEVDPEWIVTENPNAIVVGASGCKSSTTGYFVDNSDEAETLIETTSEVTGLGQTDAVKNNKVLVIDSSCEETVRSFVGVYYLAKWFYPEEFEDLDPEEIHREYFEVWLGVPYQGIWAYPRESA